MNAGVRASLFVGGFLAVMISSAEFVSAATKVVAAGSSRTINDSLVQNLSCRNLNVNTIYRAIREDAFAESRNMDIVNWNGNCWGLASTQRMLSYMARYNQRNTMNQNARTELVLNMVGRNVPSVQDGRVSTAPLKTFSVFPVEGNSVVESYDLWWGLRGGYDMNLSKKYTVQRDLRKEIEVSQSSHFYRAKNLGMGLGSGPTNSRDNYASLKTLMRNADGKRLTLINLRMSRFNQHIVMVKSYKKTASGDVVFKVYDSNQPTRDQDIVYNSKTGSMISVGISNYYGIRAESLGVFVVDEDERIAYEAAMLKYYSSACK
jgi:hypothetical protein